MRGTTKLPRVQVSALAVVLIGLTGCWPDDGGDSYKAVGNTMYSLMADPVNFCSYVGANFNEISTQKFDKCVRSRQATLEKRLQKIRNECDEIFIDGYDRLKCDQDRGAAQLALGLLVLDDFIGLSDGSTACSGLSSFFSNIAASYDEAINFNNNAFPNEPPLPTWSQLVVPQKKAIIKEYTCG